MKKIVIFLFVIFCFFLYSCDHMGTGFSKNKVYFNNSTSHVIKFLPYKNGLVITDSIKVFAPNTVTLFESTNISMRGGASQPTFTGRYMLSTDSVIVTFDGIRKEKHRVISASSVAAFIFLPSKERSIFKSSDAYKLKIIEQTKYDVVSEYTYTFTEQDYLDAELF